MLSLSTAGVVGVVVAVLVAIALCYVCGLLTGLLARRKKNCTSSESGDLATPRPYEEPLLTAQTSIPLKENVAYGHFNS